MSIRPSAAAMAVFAAFSPLPTFAADQEGPPVVVTATRQPTRIDDLLADTTILAREDIAAAGQSTLAELLGQQPGLQMTSNGGPGQTAGIMIRGANTEHTLVLVDGMRIGSLSAGSVAFERIPLDQIERIEIVRGPASALYGADAIGGVIQIFTRRGSGPVRPEVFVGAGTWETRETAAGVSGGDSTWSYALRGGYYTTDGINATRRSSFAFEPDRDSFYNASVSGSLAFRPAAGHELGATLLHTEGRSRYDEGVPGFDPRNDLGQGVYNLYSRNRITELWTSTLRLGRSVDDYLNFSSFNAGDNKLHFKTTQDQVVWQNDIRLPHGSLLAAVETLAQKADAEASFDHTRRIHSVLLGWTGNFGDHSFQANARHDDNSQFGSRATGALSYGYRLNLEWRVHVARGSAFRAPSLNDLYFPLSCFGIFGCFGGNPDLKPEKAYNKEAGLVWERGSQRATLTVFDNRVTDLIVWGNTPENVARARLRGVSLSHAGQIGGFDLASAVDWLHARDEDTDMRLRRRADWTASFRLARDVGAWKLGGEWQLVGGRYDDANENDRMGGYGLVNLFAHYAVDRNWTLEARANNVGDKKYETALDFNTPGANVFVGLRYAPR